MGSSKYPKVEANFLKLKEIQGLPLDSEERKKKIVERCNWYMFCASDIRGKDFQDPHEFILYCYHNVQANCPPMQMKPNTKIADTLAEAFISKYHKPYEKGTRKYIESRDDVTVKEIQDTLADAWERWQCDKNTRANEFKQAINSIPNPEKIEKVVCLGLGRILMPNFRSNQQSPEQSTGNTPRPHNNIIMPRNIAQHIAAISLVKELEKKTNKEIPLYTADPEYGDGHKKALETLDFGKFIVLDPAYGVHEQFTYIDDNTLVFDMAGPPQCPTMRIIQEYARPVAIITGEIPRRGKFQDRLWFEVQEESGKKIQIPGCAHLPLPDGCFRFGGLCPRRVRDMIVYEYKQEDKFPAEMEASARKWGACDLVNYDNRDKLEAQVGAYWHTDTRFVASEIAFLRGLRLRGRTYLYAIYMQAIILRGWFKMGNDEN
ncbi:hypothetical protein F5Y00DRAFT_271127 [Daldinia vernicosa]|uniref:uncharacterized protein n=1 Tax=Daldinia vernicosa TaxID=114800 RepID=UPI0020088A73|nr:uncharacterized protein F5Y00DRAFT_271127 [Daldinia vernicosa]KAI0847393.1 hypothetical protein F5Y00DRAFT_271127 [Daldinia vernicosa]